MSTPHPTPLAFDDVVIDFVGRRLLRGGEPQALEPKAFSVLALLAGAPGQAFARDDILDAVWGHRHVTPGVLNRVMTLLRHALGEEAHTPRYLHTLHGIGYRFDLPPEAADLGKPVADASEPAATVATEATAPGSIPVAPSRRRASDRWPVFSRSVLWSLPLLAVLAFAGWRWWPRNPDVPMTVVPAVERSIAVLPLVNASNDPEQQFFSDGLSENLIDTLSRFEGMKVIGRTSAFRFR
ncbi:MAG: winged helix-turn-helix domain-containing protein, partial [Luteimonas sp.]